MGAAAAAAGDARYLVALVDHAGPSSVPPDLDRAGATGLGPATPAAEFPIPRSHSLTDMSARSAARRQAANSRGRSRRCMSTERLAGTRQCIHSCGHDVNSVIEIRI